MTCTDALVSRAQDAQERLGDQKADARAEEARGMTCMDALISRAQDAQERCKGDLPFERKPYWLLLIRSNHHMAKPNSNAPPEFQNHHLTSEPYHLLLLPSVLYAPRQMLYSWSSLRLIRILVHPPFPTSHQNTPLRCSLDP